MSQFGIQQLIIEPTHILLASFSKKTVSQPCNGIRRPFAFASKVPWADNTPWISNKIKKLFNEKNTAYQSYIQDDKNDHYKFFRPFKKILLSAIEASTQQYHKRISKKNWWILGQVLRLIDLFSKRFWTTGKYLPFQHYFIIINSF